MLLEDKNNDFVSRSFIHINDFRLNLTFYFISPFQITLTIWGKKSHCHYPTNGNLTAQNVRVITFINEKKTSTIDSSNIIITPPLPEPQTQQSTSQHTQEPTRPTTQTHTLDTTDTSTPPSTPKRPKSQPILPDTDPKKKKTQ